MAVLKKTKTKKKGRREKGVSVDDGKCSTSAVKSFFIVALSLLQKSNTNAFYMPQTTPACTVTHQMVFGEAASTYIFRNILFANGEASWSPRNSYFMCHSKICVRKLDIPKESNLSSGYIFSPCSVGLSTSSRECLMGYVTNKQIIPYSSSEAQG